MSRLGVLTAWAISRVTLVLLLPSTLETGILDDVRHYFNWAARAWSGHGLPGRAFAWEYPPGAALVLLPTARDGVASYVVTFVCLMIIVDAAVLLVLLRRSREHADNSGVWLWVAVPFLLGPVALSRFDLVPTLLSTLAVAAAPVAPIALAAGTMVKLWPATIVPLLAVVSERPVRFLLRYGVLLLALVAVAAATGLLPSLWTAVQHQQRRGVEIESLAALPQLWASRLGDGHHVAFSYGSWQVGGTLTDILGVTLPGLGLLGLLLLTRRQQVLRQAGYAVDGVLAAAATVTLVVATDKVLSPQYLLWPAGLVGLAAGRKWVGRRQAMTALAAAAALTHVVYPLSFVRLLHGELLPLIALTIRDALLIWLLALLWRAAWSPGAPLADKIQSEVYRTARLRPAPVGGPP